MRALPLALLILALVPSAALADAGTGGTSLKLGGPVAGALKDRGVRVVAADPASIRRTAVTLPAFQGTVTDAAATLQHSGVLQFRKGKRRLNLTGLVTSVGRVSRTTALAGGKRLTILTYAGTPTLDGAGGRATLRDASVRLPTAAAKAIRKALGLRRLKAGRLGIGDIAFAVPREAPAPAPTATATATPTEPGATPTPAPTQRIVWRPRESFIRYMNENGKVFASGAAKDGPKEVRPGTATPLVYSFEFPTGTGTLNATRPERGIDLTWTDPVFTGSQLTVVNGGATSLSYSGRRTAMLDLDTANEVAEGYPAKLTQEGQAVFNGFYGAGEDFGWVKVTQPAAARSSRLATASAAKRKKPLRIVALSPFTANTLIDLGVKPVAIANTLGGQDRFRPQLKGVKRLTLSHPSGPNLEQLAALSPDVVLSSPTWNRGHAAMRELGMKVELDDPTRVSNVAAMTRRLGRLVGKTKLAERIAKRQERDIAAAKTGIKSRPRVLAVLGVGRAPYAFLPGSWGGDLVTQAGGRLLTEGLKGDGGFARISDEQVVAINPDVIIAVPHGSAEDIPSISQYLANNPAWQSTNAARNGRVFVARGNSLLQAFTDMGRTIRDIGTLFLKNR